MKIVFVVAFLAMISFANASPDIDITEEQRKKFMDDLVNGLKDIKPKEKPKCMEKLEKVLVEVAMNAVKVRNAEPTVKEGNKFLTIDELSKIKAVLTGKDCSKSAKKALRKIAQKVLCGVVTKVCKNIIFGDN